MSAKAIEAGTAETGTGSVHESAVPHGGIRPDDGATPTQDVIHNSSERSA